MSKVLLKSTSTGGVVYYILADFDIDTTLEPVGGHGTPLVSPTPLSQIPITMDKTDYMWYSTVAMAVNSSVGALALWSSLCAFALCAFASERWVRLWSARPVCFRIGMVGALVVGSVYVLSHRNFRDAHALPMHATGRNFSEIVSKVLPPKPQRQFTGTS